MRVINQELVALRNMSWAASKNAQANDGDPRLANNVYTYAVLAIEASIVSGQYTPEYRAQMAAMISKSLNIGGYD